MRYRDLQAEAILPSRRSVSGSGYTDFTEHVAAMAETSKALASEGSFPEAARKLWFAVGYLEALTGKDPDDPPPYRLPSEAELQDLLRLLRWLRPVHDNARDNDSVDTAQVAAAFRSYADKALNGEQFRLSMPRVGKGRPLYPALFEAPLPLSEAEIARITQSARDATLPIALALGAHHRPVGRTA